MSENASPTDPTAIADPKRGVLVVTNDDDDPGIAAARSFAAELAARAEVPLILYDRSEETWADTEHPDGPLGPDDQRLEGRTHLRQQMNELGRLGADVRGWVATLPSITAVETALGETEADVVVIPEAMDRKLLERAISGDSLGNALREQLEHGPHPDVTVVEVAPDGTATCC